MFGEITETVVKMRMDQFRREAERARLIQTALQGKRASALTEVKRRTTTLPGLVLHWWETLTQYRPVSERQLPTGM